MKPNRVYKRATGLTGEQWQMIQAQATDEDRPDAYIVRTLVGKALGIPKERWHGRKVSG